MRKYVIILLSFVSGFCYSQTLAIKKQQEWLQGKEEFFVGKPFSQLYDSLKIKPVSVWGGGAHWNRFVEANHKFFYVDTANYTNTTTYFYIEWTEPIPETETQKYQNDTYRLFNAQEYPTYANRIIRRLVVYTPWLQ